MKTNFRKFLTQVILILGSTALGFLIHSYLIEKPLAEAAHFLFNHGTLVVWLTLLLEILVIYVLSSLILSIRIPKTIYALSATIYLGYLGLILFDRTGSYDQRINLEIRDIIPSNNYEIFTLIINILFFIPLGYLFRRKSFLFFLAIAILIALSIESIQLLLSIGVFDINDMFLNILGMLIGYLIGRKKVK